jgi:CBS domain-containing protein
MKCTEVMTKDPSCCVPTDSAFDAAQLMKSENVGSIPIVTDTNSKNLEGIVTDRDLALKVVAEGLDPKAKKVADLMTTDIVSCRPNDDIDAVIKLMEKNQVRRIPIVDENNVLVGIIAQADIATRMEEPNKTAEVLESISQAA